MFVDFLYWIDRTVVDFAARHGTAVLSGGAATWILQKLVNSFSERRERARIQQELTAKIIMSFHRHFVSTHPPGSVPPPLTKEELKQMRKVVEEISRKSLPALSGKAHE